MHIMFLFIGNCQQK